MLRLPSYQVMTWTKTLLAWTDADVDKNPSRIESSIPMSPTRVPHASPADAPLLLLLIQVSGIKLHDRPLLF